MSRGAIPLRLKGDGKLSSGTVPATPNAFEETFETPVSHTSFNVGGRVGPPTEVKGTLNPKSTWLGSWWGGTSMAAKARSTTTHHPN